MELSKERGNSVEYHKIIIDHAIQAFNQFPRKKTSLDTSISHPPPLLVSLTDVLNLAIVFNGNYLLFTASPSRVSPSRGFPPFARYKL